MKRFLLRLRLRHGVMAVAALGMLACLVVWGSHAWVEKSAGPVCHSRLEDVPSMPVAVVLGCSPKVGNRENLFYKYRMEAAADLYKAGKVKAFIVSGDNGSHQYDEPTAMKADLVAAGIPEGLTHCDYAGFRTLDSMVRAQAVFGQSRVVVVSQRFHNERAVFLARHWGMEAVGYNAKDVSRRISLTTYLREYLARVKAVLDISILQTEPKFYGPKVDLENPL